MPAPHVDDQCPERAIFANDLAKAIRDVYLRKQEYEDAKANRKDAGHLSGALQEARNVQREADHAYNGHIDKHGCKS
jgi:hypothetical protein